MDLLGAYSKPVYQGSRLRKLVEMLPSLQVKGRNVEAAPLPRVFKVSQRLTAEAEGELAEAYRAGATTTELRRRYGLSQGSVLRLLAEQGVEMRQQGLCEADVPVAAKLYVAGWTLAQLGTKYGVSPNAVRRKLMEAGVRMRPRGGKRSGRKG